MFSSPAFTSDGGFIIFMLDLVLLRCLITREILVALTQMSLVEKGRNDYTVNRSVLFDYPALVVGNGYSAFYIM